MKRPIVVTILAFLLMLTGAAGLVGDSTHFKSLPAHFYETMGIAALHGIAIVAGAFLLRGHNWARWLAIAWITFHLGISLWHSAEELLIHFIVFALFLWALFRGKSGKYFSRTQRSAPPARSPF